MQRGERESRPRVVAMAGLCLFWMLVGPTAAQLVTVSESSISISAGNTALLPASLNFSPSMPNYFQLRWHFVTGSWLVLKLRASSCTMETGSQRWRDSCGTSIEVTERYRQRAKLSAENASLELQDVRTEDSGIYSITVLALDMTSSVSINLTVTKVDPDVSVYSVKVADDGDYKMSNAIQLGVAGLIFCLLGLIIAEHISFTHCKDRKITAGDGRETEQYRAGMESTILPVPGSTYLFMKNPSADDLYCSINY